MEMEFLVHTIFAFVCMDRVARKAGGHLKSGRTINEFYFFLQGVSLARHGDSLESDGEV